MSHQLFRVTDFEIIGDYILSVHFDDGSKQVINFEPVLHGEMWGPLRNLEFFKQVSIDPIAHTLTFSNGADFDPETLWHWQENKEELANRAQSWEKVPT